MDAIHCRWVPAGVHGQADSRQREPARRRGETKGWSGAHGRPLAGSRARGRGNGESQPERRVGPFLGSLHDRHVGKASEAEAIARERSDAELSVHHFW